ncbi:hypothetical protein DXG01_013831 [Tephrocybe rancida]|nr:hypothetical protein DXG01_013831 [Tephrocybe rancida]
MPQHDVPEVTMNFVDASIDFNTEYNLNSVLDGSIAFDLSHAGSEFEQILADCLDEEVSQRRQHKDERIWCDHTENWTHSFEPQMEGMTDAYLEWAVSMGDNALERGPTSSRSADPTSLQTGVVEGSITLRVMDPNFTFSTRVMELYRVMHPHCPHMTIEPFVKSLCDLHKIPFRQYLAQQFSFAFDLYLAIRTNVQSRVNAALGHNLSKWCLKNACPACTYKLEGEGNLIFKILFTMDGNDSLKHLQSAKKSPPADGDPGQPLLLAESNTRHDSRSVPGDRYLTREEVDRWAKASLEELLSDASKEEVKDNPCAGRWTNMVNKITAKMWGIFDETGVFLALCRHGFGLVIADMVQSGESKYPLAVVATLLEVFGEDIGGGYDIGCKFKTTLNQSELGARARELRFKALVGSFHGHAHNRICQLSHLATYVEGMGLEDLEGCKCFFSKSNHLAASIRYATLFHRQQKIVEYMAHTDAFETAQKLSIFLVNNYRQVLGILAGTDALHKTMNNQGITLTDVFHQRLKEERAYLTSLAKEPVQETLEMEYDQKLVNYHAVFAKLDELKPMWHTYNPQSTSAKRQYNPETQLRPAVQELELQLEVGEQWTPECEEWKAASVMVGRQRYQRCLDELEGLVVSHMFELTKMNMSQTGYKLRKHIGKALKVRSQAIRSTLERYNTAAALMSPLRPSLSWDQVVEYADLADFDLLCDCRQDVCERVWARPAARHAMDQYCKTEHAREEIHRLDIEIKRVITHMRDKEVFLLAKEQEVAQSNVALAYQVRRYCDEQTRFYDSHCQHFKKLSTNPLFSGSIIPSVPLDKSLLITDPRVDMDIDEPQVALVNSEEEEEEEEEEGEGDSMGLLADALDAFTVAVH